MSPRRSAPGCFLCGTLSVAVRAEAAAVCLDCLPDIAERLTAPCTRSSCQFCGKAHGSPDFVLIAAPADHDAGICGECFDFVNEILAEEGAAPD